MKTRIITGLIMLIVCLPVIIFSGTVLFPIFLSLMCLIGTFELLKCVRCEREYYISVPSLVLAAGFPSAVWFITDKRTLVFVTVAVVFVFLIYLMSVTVMMRGKVRLVDTGFRFTMLTYVIGGFSAAVKLRTLENGEYIFFMVYVVAFFTDIFAYFTGYFFGRHKLIPEVSPKKTVEGAVGGLVFGAASLALYGFVIHCISGLEPNYLFLCIAGFSVSVISQFGDLITSLLKREFGIKDFGNILPGHGGVLDRFDSVLAAAPALLLLCTFSSGIKFFY